MYQVAVLAALVCIVAQFNVDAFRVLGIYPVASYSHFSLGARLMDELADRGHDVTYINPYKKNEKSKYKNIELTGVPEAMEAMTKDFNMFESSLNPVLGVLMLHGMGGMVTKLALEHPSTQKLIASNEKFDVIIIEQFVNDALKGFCAHFKAPCVVVNSVRSVYWSNAIMGNPSHPSYIPEMYTNHDGPMNFWIRMKNVLVSLFAQLHFHYSYLPEQNRLLQKYFPNPPQLNDILYNVSVMFLNSEISSAPPAPLLPNMVEIGGYHVKEPKKLPDELQKYLDAAKNGVIYFSMGSVLKSKDLPEEKRTAILKSLGKLKQNVLWKFEADLPGKPANVRIEKWLPQADILAHPNVKLFITHGGLLGTLESIYHGVPVLGLPVFGDQEMNMLRAVDKGYGKKVSFKDLTEEKFTTALTQIVTNSSYKKTALHFKRLMHDRPMKPIDTAMYWIDYAVRHKGESHFRSASLDLAWYQYYLLDVLALLALSAAVIVILLTCLFKKLCKSKASKSKAKKH